MIFEVSNGTKSVETQIMRRAALNIRAVNHRLRQDILDSLTEHKVMSVTDIYIRLRLEQSVASQHLSILRRVGVVKGARKGKTVYYSIDREILDKLYSMITELGEL